MLLLQGLLMMLLPIVILFAVRQRRDISVAAAAVGAGAYALAQVPRSVTMHYLPFSGTLPLLWTVLVLALVTAVWENLAKWLPLRFLNFANWEMVTDFAIGFGGLEALFAGYRVLSFALVLRLSPESIDELTRSEIATTSIQLMVAGIVIALVERAAFMGIHLGAAYLNVQRRWPLLLLALAAHLLAAFLLGAAGMVRENLFASAGLELGIGMIGLAGLWYAQRAQETGPLRADDQ